MNRLLMFIKEWILKRKISALKNRYDKLKKEIEKLAGKIPKKTRPKSLMRMEILKAINGLPNEFTVKDIQGIVPKASISQIHSTLYPLRNQRIIGSVGKKPCRFYHIASE